MFAVRIQKGISVKIFHKKNYFKNISVGEFKKLAFRCVFTTLVVFAANGFFIYLFSIFVIMRTQQNLQPSVLTPEAEYIIGKLPTTASAELLNWITPSEAAEYMVTLMRLVTQSDEFATYTDEYKSDLWHNANLIRAVLFDLKNQLCND